MASGGRTGAEFSADDSADAVASGVRSLGERLRELARQSDRSLAELIDALYRFDRDEGWRATGARHCVAWMCSELGLCRALAYERYRVAMRLHELPILKFLFDGGSIGWSKIRAVTRVATAENERALAILAVDHDADTLKRLCEDFRFGPEDDLDDAERDRRRRQRRRLDFSRNPDGSVELRGTLAPDAFANFLKCLERSEAMLFEDRPPGAPANVERPTASQRRADALVAMAEASLSGGTTDVSSSDRFQVVAHVDAEALEKAIDTAAREGQDPGQDQHAPLKLPLRAAIAGFMGGGITPSTARRLACDGSLLTMILRNGEPIAVGRKSRTVNPATRRAVLARDGHACTFPGCGATRGLDVHHTTDWRFGGRSDSELLATVCRACHTRIHDEGWSVRRMGDAERDTLGSAASGLAEAADASTRAMVQKLGAIRPRFRFDRPRVRSSDVDDTTSPGATAVGVAETPAVYGVDTARRSRPPSPPPSRLPGPNLRLWTSRTSTS